MEGEVLRDDQREQVKRFVPSGRKGKRGPRSDGRRFFDALLWMAHAGAICRIGSGRMIEALGSKVVYSATQNKSNSLNTYYSSISFYLQLRASLEP